MEFKDRLLSLRLKKKVYQKELAEYLHVSVSSISNYEKGVHVPELKTMIAMADYFDVSMDYLVGRVDYDISFGDIHQNMMDGITVAEFTDRAKSLSPMNKQLLLHYLKMLEQSDLREKEK